MSKQKVDYAIDNYQETYDRFMNLAINRFKWDNLPEGLESRDIEKMLIEKGQLMAFEHEVLGLTILPCYPETDHNIYFKPTKYTVNGGNSYNRKISIDDGIVIRNNALGKSDRTMLENFAYRINEVEQVQDVNLFHQSMPFILPTDEKEKFTWRTIINQIKEHKLVLLVRRGLNLNNNDVMLTPSPYLLDKLQDHKNSLMNEVLTFLGINNNNTDKKERLVVDEVNANNDFILVNIDHMFDERKKAVEQINEKFGSNITVEKREVELNGEFNSNGTTGEQSGDI